MKQTSVERIGRSHLIPGVVRTVLERRGKWPMKRATCVLLAASLLACEPVLPSDLPGLMNAMGDYDMRVSFAAARRAERLFGKDGLLQALKHPNSYTRSKAAHFLMDFTGPDVEAALTTASADPDEHVRMWCAWSLGESGTTAVLPALEKLAQDPEEIVRSKAAEALEKVRQRNRAR